MGEARVDALAVAADREQPLALDALQGLRPEPTLQQLEPERLANGDELERVALGARQLAQARLDDLDEAMRHGGRAVESPDPVLADEEALLLGAAHELAEQQHVPACAARQLAH